MKTKKMIKILIVALILSFIVGQVNVEAVMLEEKAGIEAQETKKAEYAPGEVIVKLKEKEQVETLYATTYSERSALHADILSNLRVKYNFKEEEPVFKHLHDQLKARNLSQLKLMEETQAALSKRQINRPIPEEGKEVDLLPIYILKTDKDVLATCGELKKDPDIEYAEPNYKVKVQMIPNDQYYKSSGSWGQSYDDLWGIKKIQCAGAWDISQGEGIVVAVVDTGVDYNHEDIAENIWINESELNGISGIDDDGNGYVDDVRGYSFADNSNDTMDRYGHGTHVAGTIAAVGNNAIGVIGVAPKAKVMAVKGIRDEGYGLDSDMANAVIYAADNGAGVMNNSWGGGGRSKLIKDAVDYAYGQGCLVVVSAGNDYQDTIYSSWALSDNVITVAAFDQNDHKIRFSNHGWKVDVCAPGGGDENMAPPLYSGFNILSLKSASHQFSHSLEVGPYCLRLAGTSMAAPHVSGLAALLASKNPRYSLKDIKNTIIFGSDDIKDPIGDELSYNGFDVYSGYGRINALKSLGITNPSELPSADIANISSFSEVKEILNITGTANSGNFRYYTIEFADGAESQDFTELFRSYTPIVNGQLAAIDTTMLKDGIGTLRLSVHDSVYPNVICARYVTVANSIEANWPVSYGSDSCSDPVTADLDRDGSKYILLNSGNKIYCWDRSGSLKNGWPVELPNAYRFGNVGFFVGDDQTPSIGDIDGNGQLEVVVGFNQRFAGESYAATIYILDPDGNNINIITFSDELFAMSSPVLSDINADGKLEIITASFSTAENTEKLHVVSPEGRELPGWPKTSSNIVLSDPRINPTFPGAVYSGLAVGDVDGDGNKDIICQVAVPGFWTLNPDLLVLPDVSVIYAFSKDGKMKTGWPIEIYRGCFSYAEPALARLNAPSGKLDIVTYTSGKVCGYDYKGLSILNVAKGGSSKECFPALSTDEYGYTTVLRTNDLSTYDTNYIPSHISQTGMKIWDRAGREIVNFIGPYRTYFSRLSLKAPIAADINNDGFPETIFQSASWDIIAIDSAGNLVDGFPFSMGSPMVRSPLIDDIDGDGDKELIYATETGQIYIHHVGGITPPSGSIRGTDPWPMFKQNLQHTGAYIPTNRPPVVGTVSPSSGSSSAGEAVKFTATYTDPDGWQDIKRALIQINTTTDGKKCFFGYYDQNSNKFYLRNDDNTAWLGGYEPGSHAVIENSYVKLSCRNSYYKDINVVSGSGNTLTVKWNVIFKSSFASPVPKNIYLYIRDDSLQNHGWIQKGTWTVRRR